MAKESARELALMIKAGWRLVAFESFEEERALRTIEAAATACERSVISWSVASGLSNTNQGAGSFDEGVRAIAAVSEPALFVILDAHRVIDDLVAVRRLRDMLRMLAERKQIVVLLGPTIEVPAELAREVAHIELALPRAPELESLFKRAIESAPADLIDDAVKAALGLTSGEAMRVLRKSCAAADGLNTSAISLMIREKRQALRRTPSLAFHEQEAGLADIGGLDELKRWLAERRRAFGGEARSFGLPMPRGLLLLGVQGCGKSLSAKAVAQEWQFPLLRLDLAAAFGGGGQSPEAAIREATSVAESIAPAVLWIDEIEKGFAASGQDGHSSRVFGSFLTWLSEKKSPVFVVATANDVTQLPPELLRRGRFDELFFVDLPSHGERMEILSIHLRKRGRDPLQFDLDDLASQANRLSGAELEQVVAAALYTAFAEQRDVSYNDLSNAITETVPLYETYEEKIKELRDWARTRARSATIDAKAVNLFS